MIVGELVFVNLGEELGAIHRDIIGLDFLGCYCQLNQFVDWG